MYHFGYLQVQIIRQDAPRQGGSRVVIHSLNEDQENPASLYISAAIFSYRTSRHNNVQRNNLFLCVTFQKRRNLSRSFFCHPVDILSCLVGQNYVTFPFLNQLLAVNQYTNLGLIPELRI